MKTNHDDLVNGGYVRVTGMTCTCFGCEETKFLVPTIEDYPDQRYFAGKDFIFVLEPDNNTWYKKVDLSIKEDEEFRSSLFCYDDLFEAAERTSGKINIQHTALVYPFSFDDESFQMRKLIPSCDIYSDPDVMSCEMLLMFASGNIAAKVDRFITHLIGRDDSVLKPMPNVPFSQAFEIGFNKDNPIFLNQLRHAYILAVTLAERNHSFPYCLTLEQFKALVDL